MLDEAENDPLVVGLSANRNWSRLGYVDRYRERANRPSWSPGTWLLRSGDLPEL